MADATQWEDDEEEEEEEHYETGPIHFAASNCNVEALRNELARLRPDAPPLAEPEQQGKLRKRRSRVLGSAPGRGSRYQRDMRRLYATIRGSL